MATTIVQDNQDGTTTIAKDFAAVNLADATNEKPPVVETAAVSPVQQPAQQPRTSPLKPPFLNPDPSVKPAPPAELTADQQLQFDALLDTVKLWTEIPAKDGKGGPITDQEKMWLTRECLLRFLRATKWSGTEAPKRLLGTLAWRREYGVYSLSGDDLSIENETGKQFLLGYDNDGRPCHYMNPGRQNTEPSPKQVQHLVFMVERVIDLMIPNQETLTLLINFKSSKSRSNTAPGIGQGREVLNILQTHYPERLGRALVVNIPWIVNGFFKLITPFIDPLTKAKLKFNDDMRQHVPANQLWSEFNGDLQFEYDHATYWPALLEVCKTRQDEMHERWVKGGKQVGESEVYLKGGNAPSVGKPVAEKPKTPVNGNVTATAPVEDVQTNGTADAPAKPADPAPVANGGEA